MITLPEGFDKFAWTEWPTEPGAVLKFSPDQPRNPAGSPGGGRWSEVGGTPASAREDAYVLRVENMRAMVASVAKQMGMPADSVDLVDKDFNKFTVGTVNFEEGGHYDPRTERIEINLRGLVDNELLNQGLVAHEFFHAQFDAVMKAQSVEHKEIQGLGKEEWDRLFRPRSGYPREEAMDELGRRFPASMAWAKTWGDAYLGPGGSTDLPAFAGKHDAGARDQQLRMMKEDGVSDYSRAYWTGLETEPLTAHVMRATNETLAEVTRSQLYNRDYGGGLRVGLLPGDTDVSPLWGKFRNDITQAYHAIVARRTVEKPE